VSELPGMTWRTVIALAVSGVALTAVGSAQPRTGSVFPAGTFLTKISAEDLPRAGLPVEDAHWERLTFGKDGTWRDVWFHPTVRGQPPARGRYVVTGDELRLLGTPDLVRWRYSKTELAFTVVFFTDTAAPEIYTVHPWHKTS